MTVGEGPSIRHIEPGGRVGEAALNGAASAAAAGAVLAWAACCVLPMSLALVGLGLGGLGWLAVQRTWITLAAAGVTGVGWLLTWRRSRACRIGDACLAPSRLGIGLLALATFLLALAVLWRPLVEPWALTLMRSARS